MNPSADLSRAWQGLAVIVAGRREAAALFSLTPQGLAVALGWFLLSLILSAAAQSIAAGIPSLLQLATGIFIQAVTVAVLAFATAQSLRFLKLSVPVITLLVPIVYFMALVQILAIPLNLMGPNAQLIAMLVLALLIWRAAAVLAGMGNGIALAYSLLCLLVLVVVTNALYMLLLALPSPA